MASEFSGTAQSARAWAFITNHAQVLLAIARNPRARVQDLAATVQLTDRAVYRILADLQKAGYLTREKHGPLMRRSSRNRLRRGRCW